MAMCPSTTVNYQQVNRLSDRIPEKTDNCIVCGTANWGIHSIRYGYPGKIGTRYVHKGCVIICEWFDLTVQNMKFRSNFPKSKTVQRLNNILLVIPYIDARSNPINIFTQDHLNEITCGCPRTFTDFVRVVQSVFDKIVHFSPSSSSSSSDRRDVADSKTDDDDVDMPSASNSSSSSTNDSVQGYSDDDANDVDDLNDAGTAPEVTGNYGGDAFAAHSAMS